jgi:hypothetical protein
VTTSPQVAVAESHEAKWLANDGGRKSREIDDQGDALQAAPAVTTDSRAYLSHVSSESPSAS